MVTFAINVNDNLQQLCESIFLQFFGNREPNGLIGDILQESPKSKIQVGQTVGIKGKYPFFTSGESIAEWNESFVEGINLFLSTGGNASVNIFNGKSAYSTDTWCINGKNKTSIYLYFFIRRVINKINDWYFAGSGLKHLQKDSFAQIPLYIPTDYEISRFNSIAVYCYKMISDNYLENKSLESIRNSLSPLLMNGQVPIE